MRLSNDNAVWSDWEPYSTSRTWALSSGDGAKSVLVEYKDGGGAVSGSFSDTIVLDTTAPVGVISIDDGAQYTGSSSVTLSLGAYDPASGVTDMKFSNNGITWSGWEPYNTSKSWTLASGTGTKTVYVKYRDAAGNSSASLSDEIDVETTPPTGTISINDDAVYTNTTTVTLSLSASDSESGVSQMRFSNDNALWSDWESYASNTDWELSSGDGSKSVYVQYKDAAGNESSSYSDSIILDSGIIVINNGDEYTQFTTVSLSLSYAGANQMRLSSDGGSWSDWESYSTSRYWPIGSEDGTKSVYVQYKDGSGVTSPSFSDSIVLDTSGPSGSVLIAGGALYTGSTSVELSVSATDSGSGVSEMKFSSNGITWSGWEPYDTSKSWSLSGSWGISTVYAKFKDGANNSSANASDDIWLVEHAGIDIGEAKSLADGTTVGLSSKVVTAVFGDMFYIEESDRLAGIMVAPIGGIPDGLTEGSTVEVAGYMRTNAASERWIEADVSAD